MEENLSIQIIQYMKPHRVEELAFSNKSFLRTMLRVSAPQMGRDLGPSHFDELHAFGGERPDSAPLRRSRKVVEYFWIPTDQE